MNKCDDIDQNADSPSHSEHANDEGDNSDSIKDSGDNVSIATDASDVTESDIEIMDGQFSWGFDDHDVSLRDINISIPSGEIHVDCRVYCLSVYSDSSTDRDYYSIVCLTTVDMLSLS